MVNPPQGVPKRYGHFHISENTTPPENLTFNSILGNNSSTLEVDVAMTLPFDMTITKMEVLMIENTKSEDTKFIFRDDGVDTTTFRVDANSGKLRTTSEDLDIFVEKGSIVSVCRDNTGSQGGFLYYNPLIIWFETN